MATVRMILLVSLLTALSVGCDRPPEGPKTADGKAVRFVPVNPADAEEKAAVGDLDSATVAYKHALKVLDAYYVKSGDYDKQIWAETELANLVRAQTFEFTGTAAPAAPPSESVEDINEAAVVEAVLSARKNWLGSLDALDAFYSRKGLNFKLALVRNIKARFDPIRTYAYFMRAEVPPETLKPTEVVPAADAMFDEALKLHKKGKPLPGITDYPKQRKSLLMFRQLVDKYPTSTKIAPSAYYIGEIYKEYFRENVRALAWYERAWQWDRHILLPARSQAAFIYDFRLGQPDNAIRLYGEAIKHEQFDSNRVRYARQRIRELVEASK